MAEAGLNIYIETLQQVLNARKDWLDRTELVKLKEELRYFQGSFSTLYNIYLKKKLIDEDPYKQETKISELEVPDSSSYQDGKRIEQLTIRLASFDNQLDFLVNFYQLNVDFLNLDRIKRIVGLIRYIDWVSLVPDSESVMTKAVSGLTVNAKVGVDTLTISIIGECLSKLSKSTVAVMKILKDLNTYYRENYKLEVRQKVTQFMAVAEAIPENIRKKMSSAMQGKPFYRELIEELVREDYSPAGSDLRDSVLNSLRIVDEKPKVVKPVINYKNILLDGIIVIGGSANTLTEITFKLDENHLVLESRKKSFIELIKELIRQITNAEPEEVVYTVEYMDLTKGIPIKEKINFHQFRADLDKKIRILSSFVRGPAYNKLTAMPEEQIIGYLERNIKDVQNLHKTLGALDDYFKANVAPESREKIKGIKPDLSALKNSFVKANQLRHDYSAQKEEEEQMKRLGVASMAAPPETAPPAVQ